MTEKSITPTDVGINLFINNKIGLDIWKTISIAGFLLALNDWVNQLETARIIKIIVKAFNKLNKELLKENIINFSIKILLPNILVCK